MIAYNVAAANWSKTRCSRIDNVWKAMMYKIYGVSSNAPKSVFAYTGCLPLHTDIVLRKLKFLRNCDKTQCKLSAFCV